MRYTKKYLQDYIEDLSTKVSTITGKKVEYKLFTGDARLGKIYSIGMADGMTICSFMSAKELDTYIKGMYKAFSILSM